MMHHTRPTLVMIPGTLCDERLFEKLAKRLRPVAHIHHASLHGMRDIEQWVRVLLATAPPSFVVAGFSLGGILALEVLRRAPDRVAGLAMIASNAESASPVTRRRSAMNRRLYRQRGFESVIDAALPSYFLPANQRRDRIKIIRKMASTTPRRAALAQFDWIAARPGGMSLLHAFARPVLIVSGAQDKLCPPRLQRRMVAAQPLAQWSQIRSCGHLIPLEASGHLAAIVGDWIRHKKWNYAPTKGETA